MVINSEQIAAKVKARKDASEISEFIMHHVDAFEDECGGDEIEAYRVELVREIARHLKEFEGRDALSEPDIAPVAHMVRTSSELARKASCMSTAKEFIEVCDDGIRDSRELARFCDEEDGVNFAKSVEKRITDIRATVLANKRLSNKQYFAVKNMIEGIRKWAQ